jgi:hypothetical protein
MVHKKAARLNASIHEVGDMFQLVYSKEGTAFGLPSTELFGDTASALDALEAGQVVFEAPKPTPINGKCGVMGSSYHERYSANPGGPGCNDDLDLTMRDTFHRVVKDNKTELDLDAMRSWAESGSGTHSLWNPAWESLNPGMQRMNLVNRVRGYLRNHPNDQIAIGDKVGRFGIEPSAKALKKQARLVA